MDSEAIFRDKMDSLIMNEMERTNTPGTAVAVIDDGRLALTRCYGARDFERNRPVTPDTMFNIASVTKSFICAGILKLQEEAKLDIEDPIAEYLPVTIGFQEEPIRIHHLMTHTSGIPNLTDGLWARNREQMFNIPPVPRIPFTSWDDAFRFLNGAQEFLVPPGRRFHYNNFAYGLLSKIIDEVAQESFKTFLRKKILDPLNMKNTGFYDEIKENSLLARTYITKPESETREFIPYPDHRPEFSVTEAAGGLFSTVQDLANYMKLHLEKGWRNGNQILLEENVQAMQTVQFREQYPNASFAAAYGQTKSGYGFGFAIDEDFHGHKLVQHSGSHLGASAWFCFIPKLRRGVIMLSNHHPSPRIFSQAIMLESLGLDATMNWQLLKLRKHHEQLTGIYHTYRGINKIKVSSKGGALLLEDMKGRTYGQLIPMNGDPYTLDYYLPTEMGGKEPAQFEKKNDTVWLTIERNRWKKVRDIRSS